MRMGRRSSVELSSRCFSCLPPLAFAYPTWTAWVFVVFVFVCCGALMMMVVVVTDEVLGELFPALPCLALRVSGWTWPADPFCCFQTFLSFLAGV